MGWLQWILSSVIALSTIVTVTMVNKPRKPITAGTAAIVVVLNGLMIIAIVFTNG